MGDLGTFNMHHHSKAQDHVIEMFPMIVLLLSDGI